MQNSILNKRYFCGRHLDSKIIAFFRKKTLFTKTSGVAMAPFPIDDIIIMQSNRNTAELKLNMYYKRISNSKHQVIYNINIYINFAIHKFQSCPWISIQNIYNVVIPHPQTSVASSCVPPMHAPVASRPAAEVGSRIYPHRWFFVYILTLQACGMWWCEACRIAR